MRRKVAAGAAAVVAVVAIGASLAWPGGWRCQGGRLTVHEWGTFTSVVGADGVPVAWRPLSGASDLPRFVYARRFPPSGPTLAADNVKARLAALVRMETPVLYFYPDRPVTVSVDVGFPSGLVTEWYPRSASSGAGISWRGVEVVPNAEEALPTEAGPSHYYEARATDAALVRTAAGAGVERERFLFYRGLGRFDLPLDVRLEERQVVVAARDRALSRVIVFENRDGHVGHAVARLAGREARVPRPTLDGSLGDLWADLHDILVAEGLYPREAAAMIETWRDDWFEDGLRVFYVLPRRTTDAVLPLSVKPRPDVVVRVMVARTEVLTPEAERSVLTEVEGLGASPEDLRAGAEALLEKRGRFLEPILRRLASRTAGESARARIDAVLSAAQGQ